MAGGTMTPTEFDETLPRLGRLTLDTIKIARAVLVDGKRPAEAGQENGMSRQRVNAILKRFEVAAQEVPKGWRKIEVWLPPELAKQVELMAENARAATGDAAIGTKFSESVDRS